MSGHLDERTIEALAHGRYDLAGPSARAHVASCAECAARIEDAGAVSGALSRALTDEAPTLDDADLAALVATAIARAEVARPPSRAALALSALAATLVLAACALVSYRGVPTSAGVFAAVHDGLHAGISVNRVVRALVPGGWGTLALGAALVALFVLWPLSRIGGVALRARLAAPAAVLLVALGLTGSAHAVDFVGDWPAGEHVTLTASHARLSQVLSRAAEGAGLGYVGTLPDDPEVSVSVREAPLRDFLSALLGDAPLRVEHTPGMLVVRPLVPAADAGTATPAPATSADDAGVATPPSPPPPPTPPVPPAPPMPAAVPAPPPPPPLPPRADGPVRDRVTLGGDVIVREGERVRSVVTMGGDAEIAGEVLGDVTTMGGDIRVRPTGIVHGELVTMGGEIAVAPGASVPEDGVRAQLGGPTRHARHTRVRERSDDDDDERALGPVAVVGAAASSVASTVADFALVFLAGLLLLGMAPRRLAKVAHVVRTEPLRALAVGALSVIGALAVTVVLVVSVVGIPAAVALAVTALLAGYGGVVAVALVLASVLPLRAVHGKPIVELATGVALLALVSFVPFFGTLAVMLAVLVGGGAVVLTRGGVRDGATPGRPPPVPPDDGPGSGASTAPDDPAAGDASTAPDDDAPSGSPPAADA